MTMHNAGHVAPISRRVFAYLIDAAVTYAIFLVLGGIAATLIINTDPHAQVAAIFGSSALVLVGAAAWAVAYTAMQAGAGSLGMRAQKIRLVREESGLPMGFGKALLRNVIFWLTCSIIAGYFSPLFDGSGRFQGWHDKAVGVLFLDARTPSTSAPAVPDSAPSTERGHLASTQVGLAPATLPVPGEPAPVAQEPVAELPNAGAVSSLDETQAAPADGHGDPVIAFVPGVTQDRAPQHADTHTAHVPPAAEPVPAVPPMPVNLPPMPPLPPVPPTAPIDVTVVRDDVRAASPEGEDDLEQTRISIPGHRLVFTWDDGTTATVSRRTIFGRNPAPEDGAVVIAVRDETLSLSKTHFEAGAQARGGWVMDRHSTNGTMLVRDGHRIVCSPGERVDIKLGDALEIGDRIVTIGGYA